jgi:hypothetical protein
MIVPADGGQVTPPTNTLNETLILAPNGVNCRGDYTPPISHPVCTGRNYRSVASSVLA